MKKRAMSSVVTTVIIVGLSLVAIAIVWAVVQNLIYSNTESLTSSANFLNLNFKFESAKNDSGNLFVIVKRNAGDGNFNAMKFIVIYKDSSSEAFIENGSFGILETKGYQLPISKSTEELSKIEGYPSIIDDSGKITSSSIHFDYELKSVGSYSSDSEERRLFDESLNEGLVLYLPFNSGEELVDKSGNKNDVINYGATWTSDGKIGGAFDFESGENTYLYKDSSNNLTINNFTTSMWVRFNSLENIYSDKTIFRIGDRINEQGWDIRLTSSKEFGFHSNWGTVSTSNANFNEGEWYNLIAVYSNEKVDLYLNGEKLFSGNSNDIVYSGSRLINIGSDYDSGYYPPQHYSSFSGSIDEVRIYTRSLSEEEILELYNLS